MGRRVLDLERRVLIDPANSSEETLTASEFDLLKVFAENPNRPLQRDWLLEVTAHREMEAFDRAIDLRITRLRRKIEFDPTHPDAIRIRLTSPYPKSRNTKGSSLGSKEREWCLRIVIDRSRLPAAATADPSFWYVGAHESANGELFRQDAGEDELRALLSGDGPQIVIDRKFMSNRQPVKWTVWPYSRSQGWLEAVAEDV
jgi:hypothetical protein